LNKQTFVHVRKSIIVQFCVQHSKSCDFQDHFQGFCHNIIFFAISLQRKFSSISYSNHVQTIKYETLLSEDFLPDTLEEQLKIESRYLRTKRLLIKVAGTQKTMTRTSAMARFAIKRFVGVRIRGTRNTTEITNRLPMRPTQNTTMYAMQ
jgi:hypothetical protein